MDDIVFENIINDLNSKCERYKESAKASIDRFKILLEVNNDLIKERDKYKEECDKYKEEILQIKNNYVILEDTNNILDDTNNNLINEIDFLQIKIKNLKNAISNQMICNSRLKSKAENLIIENKTLKQINNDLNNYYRYHSPVKENRREPYKNQTYQANYYQQYNNYSPYPEQYQVYYLMEYSQPEHSIENQITICEN
jgi:chromosome segregation ATPase